MMAIELNGSGGYRVATQQFSGGTNLSENRDPHEIKAMAPEDLVEEFRGLVGSVVHSLRKKLRIRVSMEDMEGYGFKGLLEAHDRFDPETGSYFASFAYYRIRGAILDGCRKEGWLSRERSRDARREEALDEYMETTGKTNRNTPKPASFSEAVDRVSDMVDDAATIFLLHEETLDTIQKSDPNQHKRLERRTNVQLVRAALKILTDQEREVIMRHHYEGERMDDIGDAFGHSRSWVSRVNTRALEKMREHIMQLE
jgi:RNA polymerase sigma factor for flagellar operon FliA